MLQWNGLGRCDYDDATLLAEHPTQDVVRFVRNEPKPGVDGSAWIGLRNVLAFYACGGGLVWIVLRIFR